MTFEPRKLALGMTLLVALSVPGCRRSQSLEKATVPEGRVTQGRARGESAAAHLTLTGAYQGDSAAMAICTLNPDKAFQVTFHAPGQPEVVLRLVDFKGAGTYTGEVRVRGTYTGDSYRTSKGAPPVTVTIVPGQPNSLVSGSFRTAEYKGESGTGTVSGSFERCPYELTEVPTL